MQCYVAWTGVLEDLYENNRALAHSDSLASVMD